MSAPTWLRPATFAGMGFRMPSRGRLVVAGVIALLVTAVAALVHAGGGTRSPITNLMYLPVLLAALAFHTPGGVVTAIVAGLILGPAMPLDVDVHEPQRAAGWLLRLHVLAIAGGVVGALTSSLERRRDEAEAAAADARAGERFAHGVLEALTAETAVLDADGVIVACNEAWRRAAPLGADLRAGEVGTDYLALCRATARRDPVAGEAAEGIAAVLTGARESFEIDYVGSRAAVAETDGSASGGAVAGAGDGFDDVALDLTRPAVAIDLSGVEAEKRWFTLRAAPFTGPGAGAVVWHTDITHRYRTEAQLEHHAFHDALTGLANRRLFTERLAAVLARPRRADREPAVIVVDLDRFAVVNESMGYASGDALLTAVAARLVQVARNHEAVARLGGDQFAVLCDDLPKDDVALTARRVATALRVPFVVNGRQVFATASIGLARAQDGEDAADLVRAADAAMHRAKAAGGDGTRHFDAGMHAVALERLEDEQALRGATERHELFLVYQPLVSLVDERIVGVEALARWHRPDVGLVPPGRFIPVAEQVGLIGQIGSWVLGEATRQLGRWRCSGAPVDLELAVNLSARQLSQPGLVREVRSALAAIDADPSRLVLEITESALMEHEVAVRTLVELKELGVRLAIDDFGTGFASLSYLRHFPLIDVLKIDRSFVAAATHSDGDSAIVQAVIALGHSLDMTVVAEGVETDQQLALLRSLGCDLAQGFLWARPQPAADVAGMVGVPASA